MKLGYARCSTLDQNLDWQIDALTKEGCDRIFQEKFTGTRKDRPELLRMMDMLREGDTVIICELTRLSRSVKDLFDLVEQVEKAESFREGYAAVRKYRLWNYVGTDGRCIGRTWFEKASSFVDGKAVVRKDVRDVMMGRDGHLSSERKHGRGHGL